MVTDGTKAAAETNGAGAGTNGKPATTNGKNPAGNKRANGKSAASADEETEPAPGPKEHPRSSSKRPRKAR
jgi:hypothetical protein